MAKLNFHQLWDAAQPTPAYSTWIDAYEAEHGESPVVPDWMLPLMEGLKEGDRLRKGVEIVRPSTQYWAQRSPSQKKMILETVSWLGRNPDDYEWEIEQHRPPGQPGPIRLTYKNRG